MARTSPIGRDLLVDVDRRHGLRAGIESALREAIRGGRLPIGALLPSTRALATDLGCDRRTVLAAYQQLSAEGYLSCRQGAPARVTWSPPSPSRGEAPRPAPQPRWDLRPGRPDAASFPRRAWLSAARRALHGAPDTVFDYGDVRGHHSVRRTLADYLGRARGVTAHPDRLLVCAGFTQALALTCSALYAAGIRTLAVEDPCVPRYRQIVEVSGLAVRPVRCDAHGLCVEELAGTDARAVLVTPAHQFPLGVTLDAERRTALVRWARDVDGFIVEDDYDGEFRYDRRPVSALQPLHAERVVYAGTASKSLSPGLRLGWVACPPALLESMLGHREHLDRGTGILDQLTLEALIETGGLDGHIRRMRQIYRQRRDRLCDMLARRGPRLRLAGIAAGLHALIPLPDDGNTEAKLLRRARAGGLALQTLTDYWHDPSAPHPRALVVGYGTPPAHAFQPCLNALADTLAPLAR